MNYVIVRRQGGTAMYLTRSKISISRRVVWTEDPEDPRINVFGTEMGALKACARLLEREGVFATIEERKETKA